MKKVLFIDDDLQILKMMQRKLEKTDIKAYYASDGTKGLSIVESEDIDVVFTDLMMPNLNGLSVVAQIHQIKKNCVVVVVSGNAQISTITRTMNTNMVYKYIVKPWKINKEAINFIHECLDLADKRQHDEMIAKLNKTLNKEAKRTSTDRGGEETFISMKVLQYIDKTSNWLMMNEYNDIVESSYDFSLENFDSEQEPIATIESSIGKLRLYGNNKL